MSRNAPGYLDGAEVRIVKVSPDLGDDSPRVEPFGSEDLRAMRDNGELDFLFDDVRTCIAEAVRYVYYTGDPRRRNVRIRNNYRTVDYWDGGDWWMMGVHEAVVAMTALAVRELEYCVDWSEGLSDREKNDFEAYMLEYRRSPAERESVRLQVTEVMIRPFPRVRD